MYLSTNVSTLQLAVFVLGNLFWARYRYMSLKYGLIKYHTCISFIITGKCVPFSTFLYITFNILSIPACFGNNFYTSLPVLIRISNSQGSWKYDLSGLWYVCDIRPSWNGEFSSKPVFSSGSMSDKFLGISGIDVFTGLGGGLQTGSG